MFDAEVTTTLLLDGLRDSQDEVAWQEFHRRYVPIILGLAHKLGLADADAADVAQETLARFLSEYREGKYDRQRGRLRSWIIAIVQTRVAELRRRQASRREVRCESAIFTQPTASHLTEIWEAEHERALVQRAFAELRLTRLSGRTIRAFELFALEEQPAERVAAELGMTAQQVYMAKNRVSERLREIIARLDALHRED